MLKLDPSHFSLHCMFMSTVDFADNEGIERLIQPGGAWIFGSGQHFMVSLHVFIDIVGVEYFGVGKHTQCFIVVFSSVD